MDKMSLNGLSNSSIQGLNSHWNMSHFEKKDDISLESFSSKFRGNLNHNDKNILQYLILKINIKRNYSPYNQ